MRDAFERRLLSRRDLVRGAAVGGAAAAAIGGSLLSGSAASAAPSGGANLANSTQRKPVPAPSGGNRVAGLDDWLGSVVQVANVAANMLPMFLLARNDDGPMPPPFQAGGVQFEYISLGDQVDLYAHNISGEDAGLSYSLTRSEPAVNLSVYQPLPANGAYPCQEDLSDFVNGQVYLAPTPVNQAADGTVTRSISFAVRGLAIAASVNVIGGIRLSVTKDPSTGTFTAVINTTGQAKALRAEISATGPDGDVVRAQWDASSANGPADDVIKIAMPVGVNLDPVVQSLELLLDLDAAGFDLLTAERRSRVVML